MGMRSVSAVDCDFDVWVIEQREVPLAIPIWNGLVNELEEGLKGQLGVLPATLNDCLGFHGRPRHGAGRVSLALPAYAQQLSQFFSGQMVAIA